MRNFDDFYIVIPKMASTQSNFRWFEACDAIVMLSYVQGNSIQNAIWSTKRRVKLITGRPWNLLVVMRCEQFGSKSDSKFVMLLLYFALNTPVVSTGPTHAKLVSLTEPCCSGWPAPMNTLKANNGPLGSVGCAGFNALLKSDLVLIFYFNSTNE